MSHNLNPTGLGTVTNPDYTEIEVRAPAAAKAPLSRIELAPVLLLAMGAAGILMELIWRLFV